MVSWLFSKVPVLNFKFPFFTFEMNKRLVNIAVIEQRWQESGENDKVMPQLQNERACVPFLFFYNWDEMQYTDWFLKGMIICRTI